MLQILRSPKMGEGRSTHSAIQSGHPRLMNQQVRLTNNKLDINTVNDLTESSVIYICIIHYTLHIYKEELSPR